MAEITARQPLRPHLVWTTKYQVLLRDNGTRWLYFRDPVESLAVHNHAEIRPTLEKIARTVESHGLYAAGFLAYEAAPAFDSALQVRPAGAAAAALVWAIPSTGYPPAPWTRESGCLWA